METASWFRPEQEQGLAAGLEERVAAQRMEPAEQPASRPQRWWRLRPGQFLRAAGKLAFELSGRKMPTGQQWPSSRSALGVLQLAYFSMRYGLLPRAEIRQILSKILSRHLARVNAEKTPGWLLSVPDRETCHQFITQTATAGQRFARNQSDFPASVEGTESDPPVVGTPALDCLLDLRPGKFFRQCPVDQFGHFCVRRKAQPDELVLGQFRNT